MTSLMIRARIRQIRSCSRWLCFLSGVPAAFALIRIARELPIARGVLRAAAGYNRPFPTLREAADAISGYEGGGHCNSEYMTRTLARAESALPSDYNEGEHSERPRRPEARQQNRSSI